jgi:hypothetical protein
MQHLLDRISERRFPGVRLVTEVYHNRSFGLYAKLGFEVPVLATFKGLKKLPRQISFAYSKFIKPHEPFSSP